MARPTGPGPPSRSRASRATRQGHRTNVAIRRTPSLRTSPEGSRLPHHPRRSARSGAGSVRGGAPDAAQAADRRRFSRRRQGSGGAHHGRWQERSDPSGAFTGSASGVESLDRVVGVSELLTANTISELPSAFVGRCGAVLAEYGPLTQDSGNVSWLVDVGQQLLFVKTAGVPGAGAPGSPPPYYDHAGRVDLLRNAVELAASCSHPALARLLNVLDTPAGPALVYEAAAGELIHVPREKRSDPTSAYQRFAHLPAEQLLLVFDALIDLHDALAAVGWVACDLYEGCLIVDFTTAALKVIDLDTYRRGPSLNTMGRMFGSSQFMAPEEFQLGAVIDQRTTVFTVGRLVWHFGTRLTESAGSFCGSTAAAEVAQKACEALPGNPYGSVRAFADQWRAARALPSPAH